MIMKTDHLYKPGDFVIYKVTKQSPHPGPRASKIYPAAHGDNYTYCVEKYWIVDHVDEQNQVHIRTRRGKDRIIDSHDPCLRPAHWWERLISGHRFPELPKNQSLLDDKVPVEKL